MPFDFIRGGTKELFTAGAQPLIIKHGEPKQTPEGQEAVLTSTIYIPTIRGVAVRETPSIGPDTLVEPAERQKIEFDPDTYIVVYPAQDANGVSASSTSLKEASIYDEAS